jgi:hypothetical protein
MTALAPPAPAATPAVRPAPALAGPWKKVSAAMTAQMPAIAGRPVTVTCAPGAGHGNPACYLPQAGRIEVDGRLLGPVSPATVNPADPADRDRYPVAWGALVHEAGHAAHSLVPPPLQDAANWCQAAHLLEESRMEAAQLARRPGDRRWLRAAVTRLILDDFTAAGATAGSPHEAGHAAALILAREHAGVLEAAETAPVAAAVTTAIGPGALARLRATWAQAHAAADDDARTITRLARRWCRILGIDPDAPPPGPQPITASDILDAIRHTADAIGAAAADDFAPTPAFPPGRQAEREAENTARASAQAAARQVFGKTGTPDAVTGTRPPAAGEHAAARSLTRALRDATAGTRATTTVTSAVPPGRLRMREVMANDARRAAGARADAQPFTRTTSRRVPVPPLHAGIACDISGSMALYTGPVASASWILARAASALPAATTATVLFGEQVGALTRPGHAPAWVTTFAAPDRTEQVARAIDALDGALALSRPGTARLLAIVSDCRFRPDQEDAARQRITRLAAAGCGVIIVRPEGAGGITDWPGAQVITITDPAATTSLIARAATRALTT